MCGIVGIVATTPIEKRTWLAAGSNALIHRGPDASGEWWSEDGRVGLAHRRLSIIDLSPAAHQPMFDVSGRLTIIFNGEIYNFADLRQELSSKGAEFCSQSDTEVILKAYAEWGMECLSHLNGMFAFVLYDAQRQIVLVARDRVGEKPLFYHTTEGTLRLASELKGLMADSTLPRRIDHESLDCYLSMGYVPGQRCILQGFYKLPPAHALRFDIKTGNCSVWRYWDLPEFDSGLSRKSDESMLLDELETLLEDSVRRQLVADVPVGVLLSGGVDSSLVTAMAARSTDNLKTFTVRFPDQGTLDETEHARLIAQHFGTEHIELVAQPATADLLLRLAHQFDEPIVDSSMIPTFLVSQLVRQHCVVALGGDGGDELFGGYQHYSRLLWMQNHMRLIPRSMQKMLSFLAGIFLPVGFKGRNWLQSLGVNLNNGLPLIACYFDAAARKRLFERGVDLPNIAESWRKENLPLTPDLLQRATRMDLASYLAEDILVKVDRASMLNSLEVRAPLLDYRLIEFAFEKIPAHMKANSYEKKILLKKLTARVLPPQFDRQRKQGFSIPLSEWLKAGSFRKLFSDVLQDKNCIFKQSMIRALFKGQDRGLNNGERLFALLMFELWRKEYRVTL